MYMPHKLKAQAEKPLKFVQKHQIVIACSATALATVYMTRKYDIRGMQEAAYKAGWNAGIDDREFLTFLEFLDASELTDKYAEFFIKQNIGT